MTDLILDGATVYLGDCIQRLKERPASSVQMCVTSPPYYGLRDYGHAGQIGLEETLDAYIAKMVEVFREVRRVLADDGTLWLNIGDSYGKGKQLLMMPARVALALQADGWCLRQDIIWHKPNPMPESVRDRCTKAHEYIFLLSKSERYFYDAKAVREPEVCGRMRGPALHRDTVSTNGNSGLARREGDGFRNRRSVWSVATRPYKGAHFATFPPALIEPCILAGSRPGEIVLDPFNGSGTTGQVAIERGRQYIGIELNPEYIELTRGRLEAAIKARSTAELKPSAQFDLLGDAAA